MADLEAHFINGIYCNRCGLDKRLEVPGGMVPRWSTAARRFYEMAKSQGWQRWHNRTTFDYCPDCVSAGYPLSTKMRRLW